MSSLKATIKSKIMLLLMHAKLYISRQPLLRPVAFAILAKFPALARSLRQNTQPLVATEFADLTPRAFLIYTNLKAAVKDRSKENS